MRSLATATLAARMLHTCCLQFKPVTFGRLCRAAVMHVGDMLCSSIAGLAADSGEAVFAGDRDRPSGLLMAGLEC